MTELQNALASHIRFENFMSTSDDTLAHLQAEYEKALKEYENHGIYFDSDVYKIYQVYQKIDNFHAELARYVKAAEDAIPVIMKYFQILDGKAISYIHEEHGHIHYKTYLFSIVDGTVKHNRQ